MKTQLPHEVVQDLLPGYVDQVVSPQTRKLVEDHIKTCESCQTTLQHMQQDEGVVNHNSLPAAGSWMKKLSRKQKKWKLLAAGLLVVCLSLGLWMMYRPVEQQAVSAEKLVWKIQNARQNPDQVRIEILPVSIQPEHRIDQIESVRTEDTLDLMAYENLDAGAGKADGSMTIEENIEGISCIRLAGTPIWIDGHPLPESFAYLWQLKDAGVQMPAAELSGLIQTGLSSNMNFGNLVASIGPSMMSGSFVELGSSVQALRITIDGCQAALLSTTSSIRLSRQVIRELDSSASVLMALMPSIDVVDFTFISDTGSLNQRFYRSSARAFTSVHAPDSAAYVQELYAYLRGTGFDLDPQQKPVNACFGFALVPGGLSNSTDQILQVDWTMTDAQSQKRTGSIQMYPATQLGLLGIETSDDAEPLDGPLSLELKIRNEQGQTWNLQAQDVTRGMQISESDSGDLQLEPVMNLLDSDS